MVRRVLTQSIVRAAVRGCSVFLCASCWRTELPVPKSGLWQLGKRPAELPNNNSTAATASNDNNNGGGDIAMPIIMVIINAFIIPLYGSEGVGYTGITVSGSWCVCVPGLCPEDIV